MESGAKGVEERTRNRRGKIKVRPVWLLSAGHGDWTKPLSSIITSSQPPMFPVFKTLHRTRMEESHFDLWFDLRNILRHQKLVGIISAFHKTMYLYLK
jgi:hypothetical protein